MSLFHRITKPPPRPHLSTAKQLSNPHLIHNLSISTTYFLVSIRNNTLGLNLWGSLPTSRTIRGSLNPRQFQLRRLMAEGRVRLHQPPPLKKKKSLRHEDFSIFFISQILFQEIINTSAHPKDVLVTLIRSFVFFSINHQFSCISIW